MASYMVRYKNYVDIYNMKTYHYTYQITDLETGMIYIGSRTCRGIEPNMDIGLKYFSSSSNKDFINNQKENKTRYKYDVLKIFNSREEAYLEESILHETYDVGINPLYYNLSKYSFGKIDFTGKHHSDESKLKIGEASKKRGISEKAKANLRWQSKHRVRAAEEKKKMSDAKIGNSNASGVRNKESRDNISKSRIEYFMKNPGLFTGKKHSVESKKKMSDSKLGDKNIKYWHGKTRSEETKKKISENRKGKGTGPAPIVKCPHCEKEGGLPSMKQWHFDNCKKNTNI
tara:strand:- start:472 stop:1332 length:861 start_codon:yes stop_codon:yes gene_type:complete